MKKNRIRFFKVALQAAILFNSLKIALVVGTVLNLINQGPALLSGQRVSWFHLFGFIFF